VSVTAKLPEPPAVVLVVTFCNVPVTRSR
jgi:hypothetical protein